MNMTNADFFFSLTETTQDFEVKIKSIGNILIDAMVKLMNKKNMAKIAVQHYMH